MNGAWLKSSSLLLVLALAGCTWGSNPDPVPSSVFPDASTPAGLDENNGGLIADVTLDGRPYNVVTDKVAMAVEKWQMSKNGFRRVSYKGHALWAIDKAVIFKFDTSP